MTFPDYINESPWGEIQRISIASRVSRVTLHGLMNGRVITQYNVAKRISLATFGRVSIKELCETETERERDSENEIETK